MAGDKDIQNTKGRNTQGFASRPENINRKGAPKGRTLNKVFDKLLTDSDGTITYKGDQIVKQGTKNGEKYVVVKATQQEWIVDRLIEIAKGDTSKSITLKALETLLDRVTVTEYQRLALESKKEESGDTGDITVVFQTKENPHKKDE